ncbi:hypothetical protein AB4379_16090 [Vibrio breoganii]
MKEIHLLIIWSKGSDKKNEIKKDLSSKFDILETVNVEWSKDKFSDNLSRFYGENLPKNSSKEKHCGNGIFTCFILRDNNPNYDIRHTSKGAKVVNTNLFDLKQVYREWTGGGHKIHATDNRNETRYQLSLLFLKDPKQYIDLAPNDSESTYQQDLAGSHGWKNFEELFKVLNITSNYLILRNFDNLNDQLLSDHPDVDLLVENKKNISRLINATPTTKKKYRAQYSAFVEGKLINFDLRTVGDQYYCYDWQVELLRTRKKHQYFYTPSNENLFYSLIYHALVHKQVISSDYIEYLECLSEKVGKKLVKEDFIDVNLLCLLLDFMNVNKYRIVEPKDFTVFYNRRLIENKVEVSVSRGRHFSRYIRSPKDIKYFVFRKFSSLINKMKKW